MYDLFPLSLPLSHLDFLPADFLSVTNLFCCCKLIPVIFSEFLTPNTGWRGTSWWNMVEEGVNIITWQWEAIIYRIHLLMFRLCKHRSHKSLSCHHCLVESCTFFHIWFWVPAPCLLKAYLSAERNSETWTAGWGQSSCFNVFTQLQPNTRFETPVRNR